MNIVALLAADESTGALTCLWTDKVPLAELGHVQVERASSIEFNHTKQEWEVRFTNSSDVVAFSDPSRERCVAWEIETINRELLSK